MTYSRTNLHNNPWKEIHPMHPDNNPYQFTFEITITPLLDRACHGTWQFKISKNTNII